MKIFKKDKNIVDVSNGDMLNDMPLKKDPAGDFLFFLWDLVKTGIIVFIVAFSIRYFLVQPFIVEGSSMMPNFVDKEYLLAEKFNYLAGKPKRGDVIIFRYPASPTTNFIKRVIALPGETIEIEDSKVRIINESHPSGVLLNENLYLNSSVSTLTQTKGKFIKTLSQDEYFVMGDNREHSSDSREWGVLPKSYIIGRAWLTLKPLNKSSIHKRIIYKELSLNNDDLELACNRSEFYQLALLFS